MFDLWHSIFEIQGKNALAFLQGQITNDVINIKDGERIPALLCNAQGRILLMLRVIKQGNTIFVILRQDLQDIFETSLSKVATLSRVKLVLRNDLKVAYQSDFIIVEQMPAYTQSIQQWQLERIKNLQFDIYPSSSGLFLPQDLNLEKDWVSFSKGCYRGQEIIARMHYLAKSKYHLLLAVSRDHLLNPGDKIDVNTHVVDCVREDDNVHLLLCVKKTS